MAPDRPTRRLVLASASPARLVLLRTAGFDPTVIPSHVDEDGIEGLTPSDAARCLAERKTHAVAGALAASDIGTNGEQQVVVGCDSLLAVDGELRGKPASLDQARTWWHAQRGGTGTLVTGHCVVVLSGPGDQSLQAAATASTLVRFGRPTDDEIEAYLATGEPLQVAGAATIDGFGAPFVEGIEGDHGTVVGLSLPLLRTLLAQLGIPITDLWAQP